MAELFEIESGKLSWGEDLNLPVYLDDEVQSYLSAGAASKGVELGQLVNDLLRRDIELVEAVK